jgi:hypothetical protein
VPALEEEKEETSFLLNKTPRKYTQHSKFISKKIIKPQKIPQYSTFKIQLRKYHTENDNWLEKEDELIAAKEEAVTENPIPQEIVKQNFKVESEALNIFEESWEENQTKDQTLQYNK